MYPNLNVCVLFLSIYTALFLAVSCCVYAEETELPDSVILEAADTINPDPEWYVAPLSRDSVRAGKRALVAAATCTKDSVQIFNVDSVLTDVLVYEYGDTTRTITWTINPDGSRFGTSRSEEKTSGDITFTASYEWDFTANDWKGISKEEHTFDGNNETLRTLYDWQNGAWSANTRDTWVYDAGREIEYTTYTRNNTTLQLVPSQQRLREYNTAGKLMLDIQYTAHNGTDWSAGTKRVYDYDGSNKVLDESYSLSNGAWVGSSKEVWKYTAGKKTYYEKDTWSNGAWIGSSKELWVFSGNNQTLHEKYGWENSDWAITLQENSNYDGANRNISVENYSYSNGVATGSRKEDYSYWGTTSKKTDIIVFSWSNNGWIRNQWSVTGYDDAGNTIETCKYKWVGEAWIGTGNRTLKTFNNNKKVTEQIIQTWPTNAISWVNSSRKTTEYSNSKTTQEASYVWQNDNWVGTTRKDYHFDTAGNNDTIKTYIDNGSGWVYSLRTINTFENNVNVMTHNSQWDGSVWVMTSMTRKDILKKGQHEILNVSWKCSSDSIWIGVSKDTTAYTTSDDPLYMAHYSWASNSWKLSYEITYVYDNNSHLVLNERWEDVNSVWQGDYRYEYEYDANGKETKTIVYDSWNATLSKWVGTAKFETTYNNQGKASSMISYGWKNNDWDPTTNYIYRYDTSNRLIEQIDQKFSNGGWVNFKRYENAYHGSELVKDNEYSWENDAWQWKRRNETYYDDDAQAKLRREVKGSWSNGNVLSFEDNHYFYACDPHLYTIRFLNENGSILESKQVQNGAMPAFSGETPTKESTAEFTYTFAGWDKTIAAATADATYTATFSATKRQYTITWLNEDGTEISHETLEYGLTPTHADINKESTAEYTYTFAGWDKELVAVEGDATYTATFTATKRQYTITWLNEDNSQLAQTTVEYGVMPTAPEAPTKGATAEYTYAFAGWNKELVAVEGDATYTATFTATKRQYTITWLNEDNSQLAQTTVEYGVMPTAPEAPTKGATAEYTYAFAGWNKELVAVEGDATYTATFTATKRQYTITWLNEDNSQLAQTTVEYGVMPTAPEAPTKGATAEYTYAFAGWNKELVAVEGDATYTATFTATKRQYTITWLNEDNSQLAQTTVEYGVMPTAPEAPTKGATAEYTYAFAGWNKELVAVEGDATYTATFTATKRQYTITWLNEDNSQLAQTTVEYGVIPTAPEVPSKESTAEYTYTFVGWDTEPASVTGDATYTATFTATKRQYTITWLNSDNSPLYQEEVEYGVTPVYTGGTPTQESTAEFTYTFVGWDSDPAPVTGAAIYKAVYSSNKNSYTVTFYFEDGVTVLDSHVLEYGETPSTGMTPSKNDEEHYYYTFTGWSPEITPVTGDASYTPVYTKKPKQYTITFRNYNGRPLWTNTVPYGETPVYNGETPTRPRTRQYSYEFAGWSPELTAVSGNATYTALFTETVNTYTITWLNSDNSPLYQDEVEYGTMPEYQGETPTKDPDAEYRYEFAGWTPRIVAVFTDATYTATYTRHDLHEGIDDVQSPCMEAQKVLRDGTFYILRGDKVYTTDGVLVE